MSFPSNARLATAGFFGGVVLNAIDTPWSVFVMVPRLQAFLDGHGPASSPLTGPWFLLAHFVYVGGIAWLYALMRDPYGAGWRTALAAGGVLLILNRLFGAGNGFIGILPFPYFLGFSVSFVAGSLSAALAAGWVVDGEARKSVAA